MKHQINYIAYGKDQQLKQRSIQILNQFLGAENYEISPDENGIVFVASGGSEQNAVEITRNLDSVILLCHRESNSYAAGMEIAAYLRKENKRVRIIDVLAKKAFEEFLEIKHIYEAIEKLKSQKAALIGEVSDWLITSDIEDKLIKEKLGIDFQRIPWDSLNDYRKEKTSDEFLTHFPEAEKPNLLDTAKVYQLLKNTVEERALSAITVECFSMVKRDQVTACLPLAVLNHQHIMAACEGDICSMIGKMLVHSISGSAPWQANIAEITDNHILLAHCTAPLNTLSSFEIKTHFETNCGTAIQGELKEEKVAVFRVNDKLDKFMLLEGEIINRPKHDFACRTQIEFKTGKAEIDLLKNKALGNHHLVFSAKYTPILERLMQELQINRVV